MKSLTLKIQDNLHHGLKLMSLKRGLSMTKLIEELLEESCYSFFKQEKALSEEVMLRCPRCNILISIAKLRKTDRKCPKCNKIVRILTPGKND